ncbi:MAG: Fe-S cluster assembly protein SufD [Calditrichaeota bacterium]|nr:Fe-S cluster assembly protein SufD [Calditrichota bacterium]
MSVNIKEKVWYLANFEAFEKKLNGGAQTPLHRLRKAALQRVKKNGFPSIREEEWRFTNVSSIESMNFKPVDEKEQEEIGRNTLQEYLFEDLTPNRLVFVNGRFSSQLSSLSGLAQNIKFENLALELKNNPDVLLPYLAKQADYKKHAFTALNTAFLSEGAFIYIPNNIIVDEPLYILYISRDGGESFVTHPRNLYVVGSNAQVKIIESYVGFGEEKYFTNPVSEIILNENAIVDHYKIQQENKSAYHIGVTQVHLKKDSNYRSNSFSFGSVLARNDINTVLDGEGAECTLNGLYMANGKQHVDNHTLIDHAKPRCNSHELYKGILDDRARAVFSGKIYVRPDAQKTDAIQSNQNLLLSEDAIVDTKPQLEIFADDVRCTHGGTVGQLDDEGVFYLRSRGISKHYARNIMIQAFAGQVTHKIKLEGLREKVEGLVFSRLRDGHLSDK